MKKAIAFLKSATLGAALLLTAWSVSLGSSTADARDSVLCKGPGTECTIIFGDKYITRAEVKIV